MGVELSKRLNEECMCRYSFTAMVFINPRINECVIVLKVC